jgi:hypothetical protein
MLMKYGTPYVGGMFCTDRMKLKPFKKYCDDTYGKDGYETWLGIRADEPKRLSEKKGVRYLAEISDFEKCDVSDWWRGQSFDLGIPEWLGNCVFCPKKSNLKLAAAQRDEAVLYHEWNSAMEEDSVRLVDTRTVSLMKSKGVKAYKLLCSGRSSSSLNAAVENYNINLFTRVNKNWNVYAKQASISMYRGK